MKKLALALVLTLALALAGVACSKKSEPAPTEPATPAAPAAEQPAAAPEQPATAAASTTPAAAEQPAAGNTKSYRYTLEASGPGTPKMRMEYLVVPPKMNVKIFNDQAGQLVESVNMISDGQSYWLVQTAAKMAMKMPGEAKPQVPDQMIFAPDWNEFKQSKAAGLNVEDQGKAQVNGKEMTKYLVKDATGKAQMTVYVDSGNLVRRIEVVQEGQAEPFIMDIIDVEMNPATTDADFQPPAGFTVQEMPAMPKP